MSYRYILPLVIGLFLTVPIDEQVLNFDEVQPLIPSVFYFANSKVTMIFSYVFSSFIGLVLTFKSRTHLHICGMS